MRIRPTGARSERYAAVLWLLLGLFGFRVLAQLLQLRFEVPFLPGFASWHSGALPYGLLLAAQLATLAGCAAVCVQFSRGRVAIRRQLGAGLLGFGIVYAALIAVRGGLGLWGAQADGYRSYLPIAFHLVLASFVVVVGLFHLRSPAGLGDGTGSGAGTVGRALGPPRSPGPRSTTP